MRYAEQIHRGGLHLSVGWRILVTSLVLMAAARSAATASERDIIPGCGYKSYGAYEPEEPRSLDSLPKRIQARLVSHLTARLGTIVFARLQMTGGQIVDLHRLYKVEPKAREYEWVIPTYLLHFEIDFGQDPDEH